MANDSIIVGIGGDTSALQQSLNRAMRDVGKLAASIGGLVSIAGTFAGIKSALDLGSEMTDLSNRTGIAVENLMGLRLAFKDAGMDAQALGPAVNKMQKSLADAVSGGKQAGVLKAMGLDAQSLASADPAKAFTIIGQAVANLPNSTERARASIELFGKSGAELLQVFMDPNFKNAGVISEAARLLGQNAGIFDKASDALGHIGPKLQGLFIGIAAGSTGLLNKLADGIDGLDLSGFGKSLGNVIGNFSTDWKAETKRVTALTIQLMRIAFSPELIKPLAAELLVAARSFGQVLAENIPGGIKALEGFRNLVASTTTSLFNAAAYSSQQADMEERAKSETNPAKRKLYQEEADRLQKLIDDPISSKAQGIDYATAEREDFAAIRKQASEGLQQLTKDLKKVADATEVFKPTAETVNQNAKARDENANRIKPGAVPSDYKASAIGMNAHASIFADSLARIGGGGMFSAGGSAILDEARKQTEQLRKIEKKLPDGPGFSSYATFNRN